MSQWEKLSDEQWERVQGILPGKEGDRGRTAADNRLFVDAVLWVMASGARWKDLPERFGKWKSVHKRFTRWAHKGVWERLLEQLKDDSGRERLMMDSTTVKAHQQARTGKGGRPIRLWVARAED